MDYQKIYKNLPDCYLLDNLFKKITKSTKIDFDFFGILNNISEVVVLELSQINTLFPSFTPHDEKYHLKNLFYLSEKILGKKLINNLGIVELFLLALSIYCHDWGMSISIREKEYILTGNTSSNENDDLFIPDEHIFFLNYAEEQGLKKEDNNKINNVPIKIWRDYIRKTHAYRSSERIKKMLENKNFILSKAISDICIGHTVDFEYLEDDTLYPTNISIIGDIVNVKALTIYLRVIDMFDLSADRTPYILWKFISPIKDDLSKLEWDKHMALQPIAMTENKKGRLIQVDGATKDHEVYAYLMDFKNWCIEQFKKCIEILDRIQNTKYQLDIYDINWRILPIGFEPLLIKFSFDREKMFDIISTEIFNRNNRIFLRELLQNSIDAIRFRQRILKNKPSKFEIKGLIKINVEKNDNNILITWSDNGIGMDDYIVKNYLATIGKSYYKSLEFRKININMDPISEFGIGILSCFMVAEKLQIETQIDPYFKPNSKGLNITIPNKELFFRIETFNCIPEKIGTTIKVLISKDKIGEVEFNDFDVFNYLSRIANFVEFPIVISEKNMNFLILKPKTNINSIKEYLDIDNLNIYTPDFEDIIIKNLPKTISQKYSLFEEKKLDISTDLELEDYEGFISIIIPKSEDIDFSDEPAEGRCVLIRKKIKKTIEKIELERAWAEYDLNYKPYSVYRDGILLENVSEPLWYKREYFNPSLRPNVLPKPRIIVNIPKYKSKSIDIARTKILNKSERWDIPINEKYLEFTSKNIFNDILKLEPKERLYQLGRFCLFYYIKIQDLIRYFPIEKIPILFLENGGRLEFTEFGMVNDKIIYSAPENLINAYRKLLKCNLLTGEEYSGILNKWNEGKSIITEANYVSIGINNSMEISKNCLQEKYFCSSIRFIENIRNSKILTFQFIWNLKEKGKIKPDLKTVLLKVIKDPTLLSAEEIDILNQNRYYGIPESFMFPKPFEKKFAYAWRLINIKNNKSKMLLKALATIKLSEIDKSLENIKIKYLKSAINELPHFDSLYFNDFSSELRTFYSIAKEFEVINEEMIEKLIPNKSEFVNGTIEVDYKDF
jgi:hypothetical protein